MVPRSEGLPAAPAGTTGWAVVMGVGVDAALGFVCAGAAAGGNAVANVAQRKASLAQPPELRFGPRLVADLVRRPVWLAGFGSMVASFVLQALALGLGQLSAVEPVITLEVPLTLLVASRVFRVRIGRPEWLGIWVMTAAMIALVAVLDPHPGDETTVSQPVYLTAGVATSGCVVVLVVLSGRGRRLWRTGALGAAAGISFGLAATLIKETVARLTSRGLPAVLATWQTYAAVAVGLAGVLIVQAALHHGPLLAAQPGFTLMDPLVSILSGVLVYHERVRGGYWLAPATLAATGIATGVILLAHSPLLSALNEDTLDPDRARTDSSGTDSPRTDLARTDPGDADPQSWPDSAAYSERPTGERPAGGAAPMQTRGACR